VVPHYKTDESNGHVRRKGSPCHRRGRRLGYETITHGTRKKAFACQRRTALRSGERDVLRYYHILLL